MILVGGVSLDHFEAVGTWQWCNFLVSLAPAGKLVVRVNLDETCCRLCTEATKGAVAVGLNKSRKQALIGEHEASLSARRLANLLEIMRMRAANSKDTQHTEPTSSGAAEPTSSGAAAGSDAAMPAGDASSKASEGNAVELEHMDSEGSPEA